MSDRDIFKSTLTTSPECLTTEQLEVLLDGKQSNPHLALCARCQAELALLQTFQSGTPLQNEGAAVAWISSHLDRELKNIKNPSRRRSSSPHGVRSLEAQGPWLAKMFGIGKWRWAVPAAALAAVAVMAVVLLRPPKEPDLQANVGNSKVIYRSQEVQVIGPVGDVQTVPRELQWQAFPGTGNYTVVVMEVDHSQLWHTETKATSVEIPASLSAKMRPGKPILWQVTALDATGRVLGTSQVELFATREHTPRAKQPPR